MLTGDVAAVGLQHGLQAELLYVVLVDLVLFLPVLLH